MLHLSQRLDVLLGSLDKCEKLYVSVLQSLDTGSEANIERYFKGQSVEYQKGCIFPCYYARLDAARIRELSTRPGVAAIDVVPWANAVSKEDGDEGLEPQMSEGQIAASKIEDPKHTVSLEKSISESA